ncbi:MAG: DUF3137 domain-containing protein [Lentisphaeria bacterium]|nr:DUF3137 domain-containing protein [Lentisphaeria bacterium]
MDYLADVLGAERREVWQHIATGVGDESEVDGRWNGKRVTAKVGNWTITLDTDEMEYGDSVVVSTRMRAPYVNRDGFRFHISPENLISRAAKLFGLSDIRTGDEAFDRGFLVRGNGEEKVLAFLANDAIRQGMLELGSVLLAVKDDDGAFGEDFPEGVDELYMEVPSAVGTSDSLRTYFDFFATCLHQLCRIGSAYPDDPGVSAD